MLWESEKCSIVRYNVTLQKKNWNVSNQTLYPEAAQQEREDAVFALLVMLGGLLFDLKETNDWSYFLLLKGTGGTGKSTLVRMIQSIYPKNKIGDVGNRISPDYGIGALIKTPWSVSPRRSRGISRWTMRCSKA